MTTYETTHQILAELDQIMSRVDESQVDAFCEALLGAHRILAYALGRELLTLRSFAMRMMHIGLDVHMVGDVTAPPLGPDDVLLMICGPGYLYTTEALMKIAEKVGGKVVMVTAQPQASLPQQADVVLHIPAQTMADDQGGQGGSGQAMGSAFEQASWILFDALVPRLQAARNQTLDDLRARHANLE
ncbi:MAG: (Fe-S)-cluster assembly protein [Chloroflexota bacterium]|nr:MAG: (Fe-S)-cluster assembly protein [Chloroflexota bacterium]